MTMCKQQLSCGAYHAVWYKKASHVHCQENKYCCNTQGLQLWSAVFLNFLKAKMYITSVSGLCMH
jgi:hypothetical protein